MKNLDSIRDFLAGLTFDRRIPVDTREAMSRRVDKLDELFKDASFSWDDAKLQSVLKECCDELQDNVCIEAILCETQKHRIRIKVEPIDSQVCGAETNFIVIEE